MDSFYDAPRRPPPQISREKLSGEPLVPEISLLVPPNVPQNKFIPYSQWKQQQTNQNRMLIQNKENITSNIPNSTQNNSILKKVRFEHANFQAQCIENKTNTVLRGSNTNKPTSTKIEVPFEQMYMANIPSRQLDLSVIDIPKRPASVMESQVQQNESKRKEVPKTYKEFLETQEKKKEQQRKLLNNDSVTDIFNYKRNVSDNDFCYKGLQINGSSVDLFKENEEVNGLIKKFTADQVKPIHNVLTSADQNPMKDGKWLDFISDKNPALEQQTPLNRMNNKSFYDHREENLLSPQRDDAYISDKLVQNPLPNLNNLFFDSKHNTDVSQKNSHRNLNSPVIKTQLDCASQNLLPTPPKSSTDVNCKCHCSQPTDTKSGKNDESLSSNDLLKIIAQQSQQIAQQNNQLMLLQQQISELVAILKNYEKDRKKFVLTRSVQNQDIGNCIESQPCCQREYRDKVSDAGNVQERYVTSTQHSVNEKDFFELARMNRNQRPNFSIGLTTSLEVSFRRPMAEAGSKNNRVGNYDYEPPKIQEITEDTESTKSDVARDARLENNCEKNSFTETLIDTSLFQEPIRVREACPSPEPSIKIDMNDFEDTDSDDECSQFEGTFYKNLMAQVNKILQKDQIDSVPELSCDLPGPYLNDKTMHKVKEATLKHLKMIGVNLPNEEHIYYDSCSSGDSPGVPYTQDDVSFAVKQLLMKYLPSDHLAKLASKPRQNKDELQLTPKQNIGAIKSRPDFSFASVQYMKKYNLIANSQKEFPGTQRQGNFQSPKILDITKLKQQPKLL